MVVPYDSVFADVHMSWVIAIFSTWLISDRRFDFATSYILRITVSVKCFRDGMVYLGSIEFISLWKPTPSTVLIVHMSRIIYSAMDLVISSERFEGRGSDLRGALLNVCCNVGFVFHDFTWSMLFYNFPKSEIFPHNRLCFPWKICPFPFQFCCHYEFINYERLLRLNLKINHG
jgi:hypothetical protein